MKRHALAALIVLLGACSTGSNGLSLEIRPEHIQSALAKQFPQEDCGAVLLCISAHSPQVLLVDGSDRLGLRVGLGVRAPALGASSPNSGTAIVSAKLRYDRSQAALYLDDVRVDDLQLKVLPKPVTDALKQLSPQLIGKRLQAKPVYVVKSDTVSEKLQRMSISDVRVSNGRLKVMIGLPQ